MRQLNAASSVVLTTSLVRAGKIKVFPQTIIENLEEFNKMFDTEFTEECSSTDILEFFRKTYNNYARSDFSDLKHKSKEWFNNRFFPYACVRNVK